MKKLFTLTFILISLIARSQNCISNTGSLQFDGSTSYVDLPTNNNLDISDSITIEAWIYANQWGVSSAAGSIVCKHGWSAGEAGYVLRAGASGQLSFNIACDSLGTPISWVEVESDPNTLQLNQWHHVAATFDGYEQKLYIDGVLSKTNTLGFYGTIVSSTYLVKIGRLADVSQFDFRGWNGMIDEVRIWHRVLQPAEINANMSTHLDTSATTDLVGYWRMNEASGTTLADMGSGNNTGTTVNCTWSSSVGFSNGPMMPVITQAGPYLYSSATSGNQWYMDGNLIPSATSSGYSPTQNGAYTVVVTDSNNCTATSLPFIITTLNVESIPVLGVSIGQNPSERIIKIIADDKMLMSSDLKMYDSKGSIVFEAQKGEVKKELIVKYLRAGVYVLCMQSNGKTYTHKIVVN